MSLTKRESPDGCGGMEPIDPREYDQYSLYAELNDYFESYGEVALRDEIDAFLAEKGI